MKIVFDKNRQIFHLQTKSVSYVMKVAFDRYLLHLYWGKRVEDASSLDYLMEENSRRLALSLIHILTVIDGRNHQGQNGPVSDFGDRAAR